MDTQLEPPPARLTKDEADQMVVDVVQQHAQSLLRVARRYAGTPHDAQDAYQRALEILVTRAQRLDPDRVVLWIHTVVKREAMAVRRRASDVIVADGVADLEEARHDVSPEEHVLDHEQITQTAEALRDLKPQEVLALWHQALGKSYDEIAADLSWTRTKVNRCLFEGRKALAAGMADIESGAACERWLPVIGTVLDGEAPRADVLSLRLHLRGCGSCRAALRAVDAQRRAVAALVPVVPFGVAETPLTDTPGLVTRIYEGVTGFMAERAALTAIKLQSAADMAAGTKVAAVAASAAAVAGGGAVVADQVEKPRPAAERREAAAPATQSGSGLAPVQAALREAAKVRPAVSPPARSPTSPPRKRAAKGRSVAREFGAAPSSSATAARREFGSGARSASTQSSPAASAVATRRSPENVVQAPPRRHPQPTSDAGNGAEFGF